MSRVYIMLADGFETIEALTPVDIFHRAGIEVVTVSITDSTNVRSSHGVNVIADTVIGKTDFTDGDLVVLPGGYPGFVNLSNCPKVGEVVKQYYESGKLVAAICGGPSVLQTFGIAKGKKVTCHSSVRDKMTDYVLSDERLEVDGNLITAAGAGISLHFSLVLAAILTNDKAKMDEIFHKLELK